MAGSAAGDSTGTSDVVARGLKKTFWAGRQPVHAVVDVSFDMKHGEVTGLLGQNGAAKTNLTLTLTLTLTRTLTLTPTPTLT